MGVDQSVTELDGAEADALAAQARDSDYFARLESFLATEYDESVPTDEIRAFELDDGVRVVTFEANSDVGVQPDLGVTIHVDEDANTILQATAERRGADVDGDLELVFPGELAPRPEAAVRDIFQPEGESMDVEVTVTETDEITTYLIET